MKITLITACSRPQNLRLVERSVPPECRWLIGIDSRVNYIPYANRGEIIPTPVTGSWGAAVRNYVLDRLNPSEHEWIAFLDDDNLVHPEWFPCLMAMKDDIARVGAGMVTWGQAFADGSTRLEATGNPMVGTADTASFMFKLELLGQTRFPLDSYHADGLFAETVATKTPLFTINSNLCYYNKLTWTPK